MIGDNLKLFRKRLGKSQEEVAKGLGTNRSTYSGYENGVAQPNLESLKTICRYFNVTVDEFINTDFKKFSSKDWNVFDSQNKDRAEGSRLRILATIVDNNNDELIELITEKAKAGYSTGYGDPQFMEEMPRIQLPFLSKERKNRAFQVSGDSMLPVKEGAIVVAEFVQNWLDIKSNTPCIVVTKEDGIVFKILYNQINENQSILLFSNNTFYEPYSVDVKNVLEIWKMKAIISEDFPAYSENNDGLGDGIKSIQNDLKLLLKKIN